MMKRLGLIGICVLGLIIGSLVAAAKAPEKTMVNLNAALKGETNASHRYELFAQKAQKEGYPQVAKLFWAISMSESLHRNNHKAAILSLGGQPEIVPYAPVVVGTTRQNLEAPIKGESYEQGVMYPAFIKQAQQDKVAVAVRTFTYAQNAEAQHDKLFEEALAHLGTNEAMDYCVSPISGATYAVKPSEHCPAEHLQSQSYIHVK